MTASLCPGTCNYRYQRAHRVYEAAVIQHARDIASLEPGQVPPPRPEPPQIQPVWGDPIWCGRCVRLIRAELQQLDELAAHLAVLPPGIRPVMGPHPDKIRVSRPNSPSPSPAADDLDELAAWLRATERDYRGIRGWRAAPPRGDLASEITSMIDWLGAHLDGVFETTLAEAFGAEVRSWHRKLRSRTHTESYARHVNQQCPKCKRFTLWEQVGDEYVKCVYENCQARLTREELSASAAKV